MYVDIVGPVIRITDERCHVLTVQDRRSKYAVATFISNQEPAKVVETLMAVWIPSFGLPGLIQSEKGEKFEDQVWRAMCDRTQNWKPHIKRPTLTMTEKFSDYLNILVDGGLLMYQPFL